MSAPKYQFNVRWKEELVCSCPEGALVLDFTMGVPTVYFPSEEIWQQRAPAWAKDKRVEILDELTEWCRSEKVPLIVDDTGSVGEP